MNACKSFKITCSAKTFPKCKIQLTEIAGTYCRTIRPLRIPFQSARRTPARRDKFLIAFHKRNPTRRKPSTSERRNALSFWQWLLSRGQRDALAKLDIFHGNAVEFFHQATNDKAHVFGVKKQVVKIEAVTQYTSINYIIQ